VLLVGTSDIDGVVTTVKEVVVITAAADIFSVTLGVSDTEVTIFVTKVLG